MYLLSLWRSFPVPTVFKTHSGWSFDAVLSSGDILAIPGTQFTSRGRASVQPHPACLRGPFTAAHVLPAPCTAPRDHGSTPISVRLSFCGHGLWDVVGLATTLQQNSLEVYASCPTCHQVSPWLGTLQTRCILEQDPAGPRLPRPPRTLSANPISVPGAVASSVHKTWAQSYAQ